MLVRILVGLFSGKVVVSYYVNILITVVTLLILALILINFIIWILYIINMVSISVITLLVIKPIIKLWIILQIPTIQQICLFSLQSVDLFLQQSGRYALSISI